MRLKDLASNNPDKDKTGPIWREVVDFNEYYIYPNSTSPSRGRTETLEWMKGSVPKALKRNCRRCREYRSGVVSRIGNQVTFWDSETQMPTTMEIDELQE